MILNSVFYHYLELAAKIEVLAKKHSARTNTFFPLRCPTYKQNPNYNPKINPHPHNNSAYIVDEPATVGSMGATIHSMYCCGLGEITALNGALANNSLFRAPTTVAMREIATELKVSVDDLYKASFARELTNSNVGFLIYNSPGETDFSKALKEFGFVEILRFCNPNHGGREVIMLGCHSMSGSKYAEGKSWVNFFTTNPAKTAVPETTSASTKTAANSASAVIGMAGRKGKIA